jgi:hypothetical protein
MPEPTPTIASVIGALPEFLKTNSASILSVGMQECGFGSNNLRASSFDESVVGEACRVTEKATRKTIESLLCIIGGWPGLNGLEFVDMGSVRGYHFGNSRESRERRRVPQVPVFGTWVLGWQFLLVGFPDAGGT